MQTTLTQLVLQVTAEFVDGITAALPRVLSGLVFFALAYLAITFVRSVLRRIMSGVFTAENRLVGDFAVLVVTIFMWFGAGLTLLSILGLGDIAASLGTAAGFIALGVSYALSDMIEDTVAGIYLIKDPDFDPGDSVAVAGTTGTVSEIGLRKSRLTLESGDTLVLANRDVEQKWTKRTGSGESPANSTSPPSQ
ncbi:MAG: mechanosensitive ion channel domain-containing protein [Halodesulfurarchaeum sp.]